MTAPSINAPPRSYAGIGSRSTPHAELAAMRALAARLACDGWVLRSGAAEGADAAFEVGAGDGPKEVFLPWRGFAGSTSSLVYDRQPGAEQAMALAAQFHPAWSYLVGRKAAVRKLMARNVMQVLGRAVDDPVRFVVVWAPDPVLDATGRVMNVGGGTGLAVRLAYAQGIPVIHLGLRAHAERIHRYLATGEDLRPHPAPTSPYFPPGFDGVEWVHRPSTRP